MFGLQVHCLYILRNRAFICSRVFPSHSISLGIQPCPLTFCHNCFIASFLTFLPHLRRRLFARKTKARAGKSAHNSNGFLMFFLCLSLAKLLLGNNNNKLVTLFYGWFCGIFFLCAVLFNSPGTIILIALISLLRLIVFLCCACDSIEMRKVVCHRVAATMSRKLRVGIDMKCTELTARHTAGRLR